MVYASLSATTQRPSQKVKYPIVLGDSILKPCSSRKFVNIKCSGLPQCTKLRSPGVLTPSSYGCSLELGTSVGLSQAVRVACKRQRSLLHEHDLVLVFHDEKFWLERVDHTYVSCGSAKLSKSKKHLPLAATDVMENDPDSWMQIEAMDDCGSPLTPERKNQADHYDTHSEIEETVEIEVELETDSSSDGGSCIEPADPRSGGLTTNGELGRSNLHCSQDQSGARRRFLTLSDDSDSQCNSYNSSDYTDASSEDD
ncbi:hypothetical protein BWQ96_01868 [Gracilariopsis chorda]|uniref:Uncharacterized protein n=1 Tax=Gracilariopsis chorda TaxID=448386 RepID=A0A2V3J1X9_9FLOR|nr:hypothetical protein BWQ96_01868 [Gracilariopsis chorda]|eukprot:PXF48408.1 hypothetical protein BWQ96_01868 [Gracilariopsis chorda]